MKKINNKGFTLIELLATIALLSVIASISFVSINKILKENKKNECNNLLNNIKNAAIEYVSDNRYSNTFIETVKNYEITIYANILVSEQYLTGELVDPLTNKNIKNNKIKISLNKDYTVKSVTVENFNCN